MDYILVMVNQRISHKLLVISLPNNMEDDYLLLGVSVSLPLLGPAERRWGLGMKEMECNTVKRNDNISTAITCSLTSKEKEIK